MQYANLHMWSDVRPYEVVRVVSDKTVDVREMAVSPVESWSPEVAPGGFMGHCTNNGQQQWNIASNPEGEVVRVRLNRNGQWRSKYGRHVMADAPKHVHDYNF